MLYMNSSYFKDFNITFSHGIMFHHFHDNIKHLSGQGSISQLQFKKIIKYVGPENILNPKEFINNLKNKKKSKKLCITFDDALKCQYDIAFPILEEFKIKAFFFVYSNVLDNKPDLLELNRYFRLNFFKNVNEFYSSFYDMMFNINPNLPKETFLKKKNKQIKLMKITAPYYSYEDIEFRIIRDELLTRELYKQIMLSLFDKYNFNYTKIAKNLFLNKKEIQHLYSSGHEIGLHSHSHPTLINNLSQKNQQREYFLNQSKLKKILKKSPIISMSHPCGYYSKNIINVLKKLKIKIGFRDNIFLENRMKKINETEYEIARQDHSNIIKFISK